jgi:hypothetical protein
VLPQLDQEFLNERAPSHTVSACGGMIAVIIPSLELPAGLRPSSTDLLIRLSAGYPDVAPDMWWFAPAVHRADGRPIPATQVTETYLNRTWQRWSRHFQPGQWRTGIDSLESYLALIRKELQGSAKALAA